MFRLIQTFLKDLPLPQFLHHFIEALGKLPDLIAEAEKAGVITTRTSKMICDWNPVGGGGVTNCEITGIPVSWLIEKAGGYKDGTYRLFIEGVWVSLLNEPARKTLIEAALKAAGAENAAFEALPPPTAVDADAQERAQKTLDALSETFGRENIQVDQ